jgi:hypothetical protein
MSHHSYHTLLIILSREAHGIEDDEKVVHFIKMLQRFDDNYEKC